MKKEKEKDITEKLCRPIPKGDVSLDLMRTLTKYADQLEKEYQISTENYDKDLYETKVD